MNVTQEQLDKLARLCIDLDEAQNSGENEKYAMLQSLWLNTTDRLYAAEPGSEAYIQRALPKLIPVIQGDLERQARIAQRAERMTQKRQEEFRTLQQEIIEIELHLSKMQDALDPQRLGISALRQSTPFGGLLGKIDDKSQNWTADDHTDMKAYIFACFSELAYLQYSKYDLIGRGRYKVVPSELLGLIQDYDIKLDIEKIFRGVQGERAIGAIATDPGREFVYVTFWTPEFVVVAVRGTVILSKDVLIDAKFKRIWDEDHSTGYHGGFFTEALTAMPELKEVNHLKYAGEGKPVYFTGHSLGGAVAWILSQIWDGKHKVMTPYLYASPRIGNEKVAKMRRIYSYVRTNDMVPRVPPLSFGFCDPDFQIEIPGGDPWKAGWEMMVDWWHAIGNHKIGRYRRELGYGVETTEFSPMAYYDALYDRMRSVYKKFGEPFPLPLEKP
jgi:hypothetical protein